jgi:hypothetical protein
MSLRQYKSRAIEHELEQEKGENKRQKGFSKQSVMNRLSVD